MAYTRLEDQIIHRRAAWLLPIRNYLITKAYYDEDVEALIESSSHR